MTDLYKLIKRRQDELRGREEDWIDRLFGWIRDVDWVLTGFIILFVMPLTLLFWGALVALVRALIS